MSAVVTTMTMVNSDDKETDRSKKVITSYLTMKDAAGSKECNSQKKVFLRGNSTSVPDAKGGNKAAWTKVNGQGFPGGAVVKDPPANAGDTGSSPGPGRSHMPRSNEARAPQLLSLRSRAREPQLPKPTRLEPVLRNKRSHRHEKPAHRNKE